MFFFFFFFDKLILPILAYGSEVSGFQGGTSIADHLCYLFLVFVMPLRLFVAA